MSMDTPAAPESNASLSVRDAAALFSAPEPERKEPEAQAKEPAKVEHEKVPEATQADDTNQPEPDEGTSDVEMVEVDIDGFKVQVPKDKAETLEKDRLRQADYTRKTMAAAEERKAAEAETSKARQEREQYGRNLAQNHQLLSALINEQHQAIDWVRLASEDPGEYVKQEALLKRRQAALEENVRQGNHLAQQQRAEAKNGLMTHMKGEHQALLDKLPEWKDEAKADADRKAIFKELIDRGFDGKRLVGEMDQDGSPKLDNPGITDHKFLLLARDAMLYRQMLSKASVAAKKVGQLPQKVERPGGGESNATDGRTTAMKQLAKSGSVRDAAAVFDRMF